MGNKRRVEWDGLYFNEDLSNDTSDDITLISASELEDYSDPTIVRLRGEILFQLQRTYEADPTSGTSLDFWAGITLAHHDITAAQIDAKDPKVPWLWTCSGRLWAPLESQINGYTGAKYVVKIQGYRRSEKTVDVKGMRRVKHGEALRLVVTSEQITGTSTGIGVIGHVRALIKE